MNRKLPTYFAYLAAFVLIAGLSLSPEIWLIVAASSSAEPTSTPPAPDGRVNVRDYGAKGDGRTDDTAAIQAAFASLYEPMNRYHRSSAGGVVWFPDGHYLVRGGPIDIVGPGIRVDGTGNTEFSAQNCWIDYQGDTALFRFPHAAAAPKGFSIANIKLIGQNKPDTIALELWTGPPGHSAFRRGLVLKDMGIFQFGQALAVKRQSGAGYQVGELQIVDCDLSMCYQVIKFHGATSCNALDITRSTLRQCPPKPSPVLPALDIRAKLFTIRDGTNLEGSPYALLVRNSRKVAILRCYFEGNSKIAICVQDSENVDVRGNSLNDPKHYRGKLQFSNVNNLTLDAPEETFILDRCRNVTCELGTWRGIVSTEVKR